MSSTLSDLIANIRAQTGETEHELAARLGVSDAELRALQFEAIDLQDPWSRQVLKDGLSPNQQKQLSLHFGTLRNWIMHGHLTTAELTNEDLLLTLLTMQKPPSETLIANALATLHKLASVLEMDTEQIAGVLGVTAADVNNWMNNRTSPSGFVVAELHRLGTALVQLERLFNPSRIAAIIRRPAELFGGETALDLILRGELSIVVAKYDEMLHYAR